MFMDNFGFSQFQTSNLKGSQKSSSPSFLNFIGGANSSNEAGLSFSQILNQKIQSASNNNNIDSSFNVEQLNGLKPEEALDKILNYILNTTNQTNPNQVLLDSKSLDNFSNLLIQLGFDSYGVQDFFNNLKASLEEDNLTNISLEGLFAELKTAISENAIKLEDGETIQISENSKPSKNKDEENFLNFNFLPELKTILSAFSLSEKEINELIQNASVENQGIDLNVISSKISSILNNISKLPKDEASRKMQTLFDKLLAIQMPLIEEQNQSAMVLNQITEISSMIEKPLLADGVQITDNTALEFSETQTKTDIINKKQITNILSSIFEKIQKSKTNQNFIESPNLETHKDINTQISNFIGKLKVKNGSKETNILSDISKIKLQIENSTNPDFAKPELFASEGIIKNGEEIKEFKLNPVNNIQNNISMTNNQEVFQEISFAQLARLESNPALKDSSFFINNNNITKTEKSISGIGISSNQDKFKNKFNDNQSREDNFSDMFNKNKTLTNTKETTTSAKTSDALPQYLLNQINKQLVKSIMNNLTEVRLQLKPETLGRVELTIDNSTEGLKISILTEEKNTKEMLLSNMNNLKGMLKEKGFDVQSVNIEMAFNFDQSMMASQNFNNNSKSKKKFEDFSISGIEKEALEPQSQEVLLKNDDGLISLIA